MTAAPHRDLSQRLGQLHCLLLASNSDARDEVARLALPLVVSHLRRRQSGADDGAINDAVEDAVLIYLRRPSAYDPSRLPLDRYLTLAALRNLQDILRRNRRQLRHEIPLGDEWPQTAIEEVPIGRRWRDLRQVLRAGKTEQERRLLRARLRGERRAVALGQILGIDHLSVEQQRTEVQRIWMRLLMRIGRARARARLQTAR